MTIEEYNDLFSSSTKKELDITVEGENTTITNSVVLSEKMLLEQSLCSDENLRYGACESSCFQIQVANISGVTYKNKWLNVNMDIEVDSLASDWVDELDNYIVTENDEIITFGEDGDTFTVTLGRFKVIDDKPTNDRSWRTLTCYDEMYDILNADVAGWYSALTFPMTIKQLRDSFFTHLGITQETRTLVNDSFSTQGGFIVDGVLSGKTIIEAICELNGVFGHINPNGKFDYITLPSSDSIELNWYINQNGSYEDYVTDAITGIVARSEDLDVGTSVGTTTNQYVIENNPLIFGSEGTADLTTALTNLLGVISQVTYRPFKVETYGNPMLPLGTGITVKTRNQTINSIVISKYMTGIQGLKDSITATGDKTIPSNVNQVQSEISRTKGKVHILENTVDGLKSEIIEVSRLSIPIVPITDWAYRLYDDGQVDLKIIDEEELKFIDLTASTFRIAVKGIELSSTYANKPKHIIIYVDGTQITPTADSYIRKPDGTVIKDELAKDEIMYLEYGRRNINGTYLTAFWVLPDSYSASLDTQTRSLLSQTATEIHAEVSEVAQLTLPIVPITTWSANVSNNTVTFEITNEDELEHIDLVHGTFKFAIKGINLSDLNMSRTKRIKITKGTTVITATIKNIDGSDVTSEIIKDCVIDIEYGSRTINGVVYSDYFWIIPDSYSQAQINIASNQIVLKVDSSGNVVQVALGADPATGTNIELFADQIKLTASHQLELTTGTFSIDSTNFKVTGDGAVTASEFNIKATTQSMAANRALTILANDNTPLGAWGTDADYSSESPSIGGAITKKSCRFANYHYVHWHVDHESGPPTDQDWNSYLIHEDGILKVGTCIQWGTGLMGEIKFVPNLYIDDIPLGTHLDIVNSTGWGIGRGSGVDGVTSLIEALGFIYNLVKEKHFEINCSDMTSGMSLSSYVSLDSGYKFLCWMPTGISVGWATSFLIYPNMPYSANTNVFWNGTMPTASGNKVLFTYLEIRDI